MEHRVTDSNLIISRSDLNVLKNVLVDKIHEKSTLTVQRWRLTLALTSQNTQFMYTTNTRLNICLGFFISFLCYFPWFIIFESLNKLHKYCKTYFGFYYRPLCISLTLITWDCNASLFCFCVSGFHCSSWLCSSYLPSLSPVFLPDLTPCYCCH